MMMLPEMTDSAVARAFQRFARGAVVGFALAGLTACGGGGSSTASKPTTPEMTITPSAPTSEDFASAIDITGRDSFEVRLDSANPRAFYKIRIDEPTVLALRSEQDVAVTVYDSTGNVVTPSTAEQAAVVPSTASAGGGHPEVSFALASAAPAAYLLGAAGTYFISVAPRAAVAETALIHVGTGAAGLRLRSPRALDRANVEVKLSTETTDVSFEESFVGDSLAAASWEVTSRGETPFGTFDLDVPLFKVEGRNVVRISRSRDSEDCPAGTERTKEVTIVLRASWSLAIVTGGATLNNLLRSEFEGTWTFNAASAPRRKGDSSQPIAVRLQEDGSGTVVLTDFIEDPERKTLTFAVRDTPSSLRVTLDGDGPRLTMQAAARPDGLFLFRSGEFLVTAHDPDGECWTFTVRVSLGETPAEPPTPQPPTPQPPTPQPPTPQPQPGVSLSYSCRTGAEAEDEAAFCIEAPSREHEALRTCSTIVASGCPTTHALPFIGSCRQANGATSFYYFAAGTEWRLFRDACIAPPPGLGGTWTVLKRPS